MGNKVKKTEMLLEALKELGPMKLDEMVDYMGTTSISVYNLISELRKSHDIATTREHKSGPATYTYVGLLTKRNKKESIPTKQPAVNNTASLVERCYHLALAHRRLNVDDVADAFNLSEMEAVQLMLKMADKHSGQISTQIAVQCKH